MQRQQQRPQEPVTEPVHRWTAGPSRWRTPPWRKTPLMTSLQMRSVRCLPTGALQWGTGQSLPFPDHLPARPLAWITHQGHVALVEAPPLAPRSRTPSAEVEAVAGGAEEDLQARGNPRCQSLSSPMLTRNRSHSSTSSSSRQGRLPSAWHHTGSGPAGARDSSPVGESAGNNDRDTHRRK